MTESRQFVACTFRLGDSRSYTYHNDGEPVAIGDEVKVTDRDGVGWKRVHVVAIGDTPPLIPDQTHSWKGRARARARR